MAIRRFYTPSEVAQHNSGKNCWVSIFGRVFDLTELIKKERGPLCQPIIDVAGKDISHWFDEKTQGVKTYMDTDRGLRLPYLPMGRFLHVPPSEPTADWSTDFEAPWWQDKDLVIGKLSKKVMDIQIVNVLTHQKDLLTVCSEETITEIQDRYLEYNKHASSYTWKRLTEDEKFEKLDMGLTLAENGVPDESEEFEALGITDYEKYYPVIHVYFNDDLTYG